MWDNKIRCTQAFGFPIRFSHCRGTTSSHLCLSSVCLYIYIVLAEVQKSKTHFFLCVLKNVSLKYILKTEKENPQTMPTHWGEHFTVQDQIGAVPVDCYSLQLHFEDLSWCQVPTLHLFGSHIIYTSFFVVSYVSILCYLLILYFTKYFI